MRSHLRRPEHGPSRSMSHHHDILYKLVFPRHVRDIQPVGTGRIRLFAATTDLGSTNPAGRTLSGCTGSCGPADPGRCPGLSCRAPLGRSIGALVSQSLLCATCGNDLSVLAPPRLEDTAAVRGWPASDRGIRCTALHHLAVRATNKQILMRCRRHLEVRGKSMSCLLFSKTQKFRQNKFPSKTTNG
jgi:hypothetical protein